MNSRHAMRRSRIGRRRARRGQVLVVTLVVLLGLILLVLILFDLHNSLRAKIKWETAQQASALAGAQWQVRGLNLLGQINLIKASTMMTDADTSPIDAPLFEELTDRSEAEILELRRAARIRALTEMQSRLAFTVPVLGCFAVQQTAKQNGMTPGDELTMEYYYNQVLPNHDNRYDPYNGYYWYEPYRALIGNLIDQQCVLRVNARTFDIPEVWSRYIGAMRFLLSDRSLYTALRNGNYCHNQVIRWAKQGIAASGDWWKVDYFAAPFVEESEVMTLGVAFGTNQLYDTEREQIRALASDWQLPDDTVTLPKLLDVEWCNYDGNWDLNESAGYQDHMSNFKRNIWLRENIRPGLMYDGAYTAVDNYFSIPRFSRTTVRPPLTRYRLIRGSGGTNDRTLAIEQSGHRNNLIGMEISSRDAANYGVVAKPVGYFNDGRQSIDLPTTVPMILPIFRQATLVPLSLPYSLSMMTDGTDALRLFLLWLRDTADFHRGTPPAGTEWMRDMLLKLEDEKFMKSIYNTAFAGADTLPEVTLFTTGYHYSDQNTSGAGWLQQAWIGQVVGTPNYKYDDKGRAVSVPSNTPTKEENISSEPDGAVRTYYGNPGSGYSYFLTKNGKIMTNEDIACGPARWGGSSPSPIVPGSNTGPGKR